MATISASWCIAFCTTPLNPKKLLLANHFVRSSVFHSNHVFKMPNKLTSISSTSSSFEFNLAPPPIDHDLLDTMVDLGAKVSEEGVVETFGNDDEAIHAAYEGVAVVDLTHFGRIRVTGEDRIQFLHNQTTANFEGLSEGQGCDTVFVTPTARTIDIAHAWVMKSAITLVVSPITCRSITEMLTKYVDEYETVESDAVSIAVNGVTEVSTVEVEVVEAPVHSGQDEVLPITEPASTVPEDTPKKSYASIVKVMKETTPVHVPTNVRKVAAGTGKIISAVIL